MSKLYKNGSAFILSLVFLVSCGTKSINDLGCERSTIASPAFKDLKVNVYLDGTPSMQGYVSTNNSRYSRTLDAVFNMLEQSTPLTLEGESDSKPSINYLRLGENKGTSDLAKPLSGSDHLRAVTPEFYNGKAFPLLSVTQIDAAIASAEPETLTMIITDMYQEDQYVNEVIEKIENRLEATPQGAIGVVGVRSEFSGEVFTEALSGTPKFTYSTTAPSHPFYILLIGRVDEVAFYMSDLEKRLQELSFQEAAELVLFSPERLHKRIPIFKRKERSDFPETVGSDIQVPTHKMAFGRLVRINLKDDAIQPLILKDSGDALTLPFELAVEPVEKNVFYPSSLGIALNRNHQSFDISSKAFAPKDSPALDEAFEATNPVLSKENLSFEVNIDPAKFRPPGIYFYTLDATVEPSGSDNSELKKSWDGWSSDSSDSAANTDGSKTHNLDDFLDGLAEMTLSKMRQNAIPLGQSCYLIESP